MTKLKKQQLRITHIALLIPTLFLGVACGGSTDVLDSIDDGAPSDETADASVQMRDDGGPMADATGTIDPAVLHFGPLRCEHEALGLTSLAPGELITCRFDVLGTAGRTADLNCEDSTGTTVICDCTGATQVQPCDPIDRTIPFEGVFLSYDLAIPEFSVRVIGTDSVSSTSLTVSVPVVE